VIKVQIFREEVFYRLRLAKGFLAEAKEDFSLCRWRACVDNSQLAVENAAKSVLGLLGPIGHTHNPAPLIRRALIEGRFPDEVSEQVEQIAECAELLGPEIHIVTDYGDESQWRTPWEIFDEDDARNSLTIAEKAVELAEQVVKQVLRD